MGKKSQSGQIALVALLVMVVLLTIGLAAVSRSVTDIRISTETKESARAFSAAEAGIEEMLKREILTAGFEEVAVGDLKAQVTVTETNSFETTIEQGETAEVNLKDYSGDIEVSWSGEGLELTLLYPSGGGYEVSRWALKTPGGSCGNNFEAASTKTINVSAGAGKKSLRVRPICDDASVTVTGSNPLPAQSYKIRSEAAGLGGETRAVEVTKSLPALPPVFDYVLFSGGGLSK